MNGRDEQVTWGFVLAWLVTMVALLIAVSEFG